jgi:uncharacterized protein (DUF2237 family)
MLGPETQAVAVAKHTVAAVIQFVFMAYHLVLGNLIGIKRTPASRPGAKVSGETQTHA